MEKSRTDHSLLNRALSCFALLVCLLAGANYITVQCQPNAANQSTLTVFFEVRNGRLTVDRGKSGGGFSATTQFKENLAFDGHAPSLSQIEAKLFDDIDWAFRQAPQIYWYTLVSAEIDSQTGLPKDSASVKQLSDFNGGWDQYSVVFNKWATGNTRHSLRNAFNNLFFNGSQGPFPAGETDFVSAAGSLPKTALYLPLRPKYDPVKGTATFLVMDPVKSWSDTSAFSVCAPRTRGDHCANGDTTPPSALVRGLLQSASDKLWRSYYIQQMLSAYYAGNGYSPQIQVSTTNDTRRYIAIQDQRVGRIIIENKTTLDPTTVDKILYFLLADRPFRFYVANTVRWNDLPLAPGDTSTQALDYLDLGFTAGSEPLLNQFLFQDQQANIAQFGFGTTIVTDGGSARANKFYVDILIRPAAKTATKKPSPTHSTVSSPGLNGPKSVNPALKTSDQSLGRSSNLTDPKSSPQETAVEKKTRNNLSLGFDYKPGQGIRFIGGYQRTTNEGTISVQIGDQKNALGSLSYSKDFALFGSSIGDSRFFRRLNVQFTGSTDFNADRFLAGQDTNERRTGGYAKAELEVFRDRNGKLLQFTAEGRQTTVTLTPAGQTGTNQNITTLDLSGFFLYQKNNNPYLRRIGFDSDLRLGLGFGNEPNYRSLIITSNYHQQLFDGVETDITGHAEIDSAGTPIFEQASLGGAEMLRGFREDDAIGRRLWSLQNELWLPVPGTLHAYEGRRSFIRKNVRIAAFTDVGAAYRTSNSPAGTKVGPGAGLRFLYGPAVFKLDWAYGIGDGATGKGHGRVYFSISLVNHF
ncbi:MAG TPA: ShlB/FhaC/HecB family hemolysin secretion/activation protein [Blastocatellia bacterium]|nr:ShlB/FhaC/HecB family hemolysin secretion/activation protein [Blastocatellia bacterium]